MGDMPSSDFKSLHLSTAAAVPQARAELAREVFGRQILRLDVDPLPDMDVHVDLQLSNLPGLKALAGRTSGVATPRTQPLLDDGNDDLFFSLVLDGRLIAEQRNAQVVLERGSIHFTSNAEPNTHVHLHNHLRGLLAPRKTIAAMVPDLDDRIARPVRPNPDGFILLRNCATALSRAENLSDPALVKVAVTHVHDLLALVIGAGKEAGEIAAARGLKAARLMTLKAHIADRLADDLSVGAVALAYGLTERYIQRLFEQEGTTFSTFVQQQRLTAAHGALSDAHAAGRGIGDIAHDCGFGDISHFNRLFKRRYGATPSDVQMASKRAGR